MNQRHPKSEIGLAEALRACVSLGVRTGIQTQWLAESLGLSWKDVQAQERAAESTSAAASAAAGVLPTPEMPKAPDVYQLQLLKPVSQEPIAFETVFSGQTDKIRTAVEIKPAAAATAEQRPRFQPLFLDRWFQGIFTALLGVPLPSHDIDFHKLERFVAEEDFFAQLPFKTRVKLAKGVHVLVDRSESMQPFWRDQTELLTRLRGLLGEVLVQYSWFEYDATLPRIVWHRPPPRQLREGTPILVVTNFGSAAVASGAKHIDWEPWLPIVDLARCSSSRIFALIPAAPESWPVRLNLFSDAAVLWDRETSPQITAKLCRR